MTATNLGDENAAVFDGNLVVVQARRLFVGFGIVVCIQGVPLRRGLL